MRIIFAIVDWLIYSSLNASIGLTLVALKAGIRPINVPSIIKIINATKTMAKNNL